MKSIATVNCNIPTVENHVRYMSGETLRDYDIIVFDPKFPYLSRIDFSAGGSCISIEGYSALSIAIAHWQVEFRAALKAGKTVIFLLGDIKTDQGATGSTSSKGSRNYSTTLVSNYQILPVKIQGQNAKGRQFMLKDSTFSGLYGVLKDIAQYRVIIQNDVGRSMFAAKDGASVAAHVQIEDSPGHLLLIPYFNFSGEDDSGYGAKEWSEKSMEASRRLVSQIVGLDVALRLAKTGTPPPLWLQEIETPSGVLMIDQAIAETKASIEMKRAEMQRRVEEKEAILACSRLLYENGKHLEDAITDGLRLMGYSVSSIRIDDLEIDHVITYQGGVRMIGESEGKDTSAVDISKFRQLESNINEDFQRDGIEVPAKGVLFGNAFRFTAPLEREEQFTRKCLVNAKRLGTALVRTSDLYRAVVYMLDHPEDHQFKSMCRKSIENAVGEIVEFPVPDS